MIQADNLSFAALTTSGKASKGSHFSNDSCSCKEVTSCVLDLILYVSLRWFSLFSVYKKQNPALWHHWLQGLPLKTNALTRFQISVEHFNFWNLSENSYFFYNVSEFKLRSYFEKKKKDKKLRCFFLNFIVDPLKIRIVVLALPISHHTASNWTVIHTCKSSFMMSSQFQGVCISPFTKAARQKP